jgi:hypothetical protein
VLSDRWQVSTATVNSAVLETSLAFLSMENQFVQDFGADYLPDQILHNTKFNPYFLNCNGATDGSHLPVSVSAVDKDAFRSRKGITQNVLACCNFNMMFTYVLAGWEGSAHDGKVLQDAL